MPSRLSSLLVRDGLVGVKRMEKAFQRQVIYVGSLDTILLEMGLVPEERLAQYLALASGLPPAARDEGRSPDPAALAMVTRELAEQYRAVPVAFERDAVRILVCAPLELSELEDLADAHLRAMDRLTPGRPLICNLGTGRGHSVREVIAAVAEVAGKPVPHRESGRRPGDPPALVASARRAEELLGWRPRYADLRATVETAWKWHSSHPAGYVD